MKVEEKQNKENDKINMTDRMNNIFTFALSVFIIVISGVLMFGIFDTEMESTIKCSSGDIGINIADLSNMSVNSSLHGIKDMNCDITVKYEGNAIVLYKLMNIN